MNAPMGPDSSGYTEVLVMLARLEGKLDAMSSEHATRLSSAETTANDHEARIRAVEQRVWRVAGVFSVLALVLGPVVAWLLGLIG